MKKLLNMFFLGFIILTLTNCASTSTKIITMKPEPDNATPTPIAITPSFIHLPIELKYKDIEFQINKQLNGLIYNDSIVEDDNIKMKVWKQAPILITLENGKIKTVLPLKIAVTYRYGFEKMGIKLYDTKDFMLNGVLTLKSDVTLNNFVLQTNTTLQGIEWEESPNMVILGKNVPITYIINPALKLFKSKIEKTIDEKIKESIDFKPQVLQAIEKIAKPTLINPTFDTWLNIKPLELYSKKSELLEDAVKIEMGMKCLFETIIGNEPKPSFDASKLIIKPVSKMPRKITANIVAVSKYKEAAAMINKNFAGREFGEESKKVKVITVDLWHKLGKMIIALALEGTINGTIYLSGLPQYKKETQEIIFEDLDYVLDTKNFLLKSANWLAQGLILNKIKEQCKYFIAPNMEEGKKTMLQYLDNYSPIKGVFVNGELETLTFETIKLTNNSIVAYLKGSGNINITIDGME